MAFHDTLKAHDLPVWFIRRYRTSKLQMHYVRTEYQMATVFTLVALAAGWWVSYTFELGNPDDFASLCFFIAILSFGMAVWSALEGGRYHRAIVRRRRRRNARAPVIQN